MNFTIQPSDLIRPWPAPGTVVSTPLILGIHHIGIVSDRVVHGVPMVISGSNRQGKVVEETWSAFAPTGKWKVETLTGPVSGLAVVERARSILGTPYDLLTWNCDHVTHYALGLRPQSPQLMLVCISLASLFIVARQFRPR